MWSRRVWKQELPRFYNYTPQAYSITSCYITISLAAKVFLSVFARPFSSTSALVRTNTFYILHFSLFPSLLFRTSSSYYRNPFYKSFYVPWNLRYNLPATHYKKHTRLCGMLLFFNVAYCYATYHNIYTFRFHVPNLNQKLNTPRKKMLRRARRDGIWHIIPVALFFVINQH